MTKNHLEIRKHKYFDLSSQIARLDDAQLRSLFDDHELSTGWGISFCVNHLLLIICTINSKSKMVCGRCPFYKITGFI
jgi:hypothetical protein